jgi:hypothetical protein
MGDFYFFLNNQPDALNIPILLCYKILHVSGIFSAHHQEFTTVHSALVSFMQMTASKQSQDGTALHISVFIYVTKVYYSVNVCIY